MQRSVTQKGVVAHGRERKWLGRFRNSLIRLSVLSRGSAIRVEIFVLLFLVDGTDIDMVEFLV